MNYLQLPIAILPHLRRLSGVQAAIWADAWTWGQQEAQAFRTNEQYAQMFGSTVKSISRSIATMREMGMLESRMVNGRQRILVACIPTNVHPHERPSTQTSIHMNGDAASTPTSMQHPHERPCSIPTNVHQVYHVEEQEVKQVVKKKAVKKDEPILMPFEGERFAEVWATWKGYKKEEKRFSYKSRVSEQEALSKLQKLSNNDEQRAIEIIQQSIANGWSGFFALRDGGNSRATRTVDAASTLEWLKSPRRNHGYY